MKFSASTPLLIICVLALFPGIVCAQNETSTVNNEWVARSKRLLNWVDSVKTVRCNFFLSDFSNSQGRIAQRAEWEDAIKQDESTVPFPNDANSGYSCLWIADNLRWRCDQSRFYPTTGLDLIKCLFDGERYWVFDEYYGRVKISAQDQAFCVAKGLNSENWLQLGMKEVITSTSPDAAVDFKFVQSSTFGGRKCFVYQAKNAKDNVTIVADQTTPLLLQRKEIYQVTPTRANVFIQTWSDIRTVNGIFLPFQCKFENYDVKNGVTTWSGTRLFQLQTCELNQPLENGYFQNVIPVGTPTEDQIENPGQISYIGGNPIAQRELLQAGSPLPLEYPGVKALGTLPTSAQ